MKYRRRQTGFTLIEVVVALAIFALSSSVLYEEFSGAMLRNTQAHDRELALLQAQSLLAQLRVSPAPWNRQSSGHSDDGWTWNIRVDPFNAGTDPHHPWQAFAVSVNVSPASAPNRGVTLYSIELARSAP
jgi:general secretion pathway protein I